ncbi:MAG: hypothetical protein P8N49_01750 [Opitutales bacterium]|nr:hypothetical protein [Opitutales bacterium]
MKLIDHCEDFNISSISIPNVENVVNPPQTPMIQKALNKSGSEEFSMSFTKRPIRKAPHTFTNKVVHGEKEQNMNDIKPRQIEPSAPPRPMRRKPVRPI